jgi:Fe-S-cluster containining protein
LESRSLSGKAAERRKAHKVRLPLAGASPKAGTRKSFDCSACGLCCTYVAIEIDGPTTTKRATEILWYLYHEGVSIYVNDDSWMVQFETTCRFLTADKRCGVYATRPHICREFSEQECEVNTGDDGHTFYTPATFMAYVKQTRPRVYAHVMKDYAPPVEAETPEPPAFQRRLNDVHQRRTALLQR